MWCHSWPGASAPRPWKAPCVWRRGGRPGRQGPRLPALRAPPDPLLFLTYAEEVNGARRGEGSVAMVTPLRLQLQVPSAAVTAAVRKPSPLSPFLDSPGIPRGLRLGAVYSGFNGGDPFLISLRWNRRQSRAGSAPAGARCCSTTAGSGSSWWEDFRASRSAFPATRLSDVIWPSAGLHCLFPSIRSLEFGSPLTWNFEGAWVVLILCRCIPGDGASWENGPDDSPNGLVVYHCTPRCCMCCVVRNARYSRGAGAALFFSLFCSHLSYSVRNVLMPVDVSCMLISSWTLFSGSD